MKDDDKDEKKEDAKKGGKKGGAKGGAKGKGGGKKGGWAAEMRVGQVEEVGDHPGADSLYILKINVGEGKLRQVNDTVFFVK